VITRREFVEELKKIKSKQRPKKGAKKAAKVAMMMRTRRRRIPAYNLESPSEQSHSLLQ
jgi:hypothetical protein